MLNRGAREPVVDIRPNTTRLNLRHYALPKSLATGRSFQGGEVRVFRHSNHRLRHLGGKPLGAKAKCAYRPIPWTDKRTTMNRDRKEAGVYVWSR